MPIYSIGCGLKEKEKFIDELKSFNVKTVIDVRSIPYSKWNPQYNEYLIGGFLDHENIKYIYMGKDLGGKPLNNSFF